MHQPGDRVVIIRRRHASGVRAVHARFVRFERYNMDDVPTNMVVALLDGQNTAGMFRADMVMTEAEWDFMQNTKGIS